MSWRGVYLVIDSPSIWRPALPRLCVISEVRHRYILMSGRLWMMMFWWQVRMSFPCQGNIPLWHLHCFPLCRLQKPRIQDFPTHFQSVCYWDARWRMRIFPWRSCRIVSRIWLTPHCHHHQHPAEIWCSLCCVWHHSQSSVLKTCRHLAKGTRSTWYCPALSAERRICPSVRHRWSRISWHPVSWTCLWLWPGKNRPYGIQGHP